MKAADFLEHIQNLGIDVVTGVPDSTLRAFCDALLQNACGFTHLVTANEGAAVGVAIGSYLADHKPACVYLQNSGIGNIVNPVASLANEEVYGIPMLFVVGWRGEPGKKDEPQHKFQGKITQELCNVLSIEHAVIGGDTSAEEIKEIFARAGRALGEEKQFALLLKKDALESADAYIWENGNEMVREQVLDKLLAALPEDVCLVSTTGMISRELYELTNRRFGHHENLFMSVGGMGHASMIALGIAKKKPDKKVVCIDGDGAALMHMGALPFLGQNAPGNFYHIVLNNQAHGSVGNMPTGCKDADFAEIAKAAGYKTAEKITDYTQIQTVGEAILEQSGPLLFEIPVSLAFRADLVRPKEEAAENKKAFMRWLDGE